VLKNLDYDFVEDDLEPMTSDGDHGLATASVIMSWESANAGPSPNHEITGVAPRADIVPLRVAKVRPIIPTPVLLRSGMIRLRRAIDYAVSDAVQCRVISISLGWLWNKGVHKAVKRAVGKDAVIVAAAGNQVRFFVVWPAHYRETIAVAACDHAGGKWGPSSRGPRVDVTAPGKNVWKADARTVVKKSSGTSYSAASVAGIAALWLGHWGFDYLKNKYVDVPLCEVFRYVLKRSCTKPSGWNTRKWGAGIVNAKATLQYALPTRDQVKRTTRRADSAEQAILSRDLWQITSIFDEVPDSEVEERLAGVASTDVKTLGKKIAGFEEEIAFHVATTPHLREALAQGGMGGDRSGFGQIRQLRTLDNLSPSLKARL